MVNLFAIDEPANNENCINNFDMLKGSPEKWKNGNMHNRCISFNCSYWFNNIWISNLNGKCILSCNSLYSFLWGVWTIKMFWAHKHPIVSERLPHPTSYAVSMTEVLSECRSEVPLNKMSSSKLQHTKKCLFLLCGSHLLNGLALVTTVVWQPKDGTQLYKNNPINMSFVFLRQ